MKTLFFVISLFLVVAAIFGYYDLNKGFAAWKISSNHPYLPDFELSVTKELKDELQPILNQPLYYLSKGLQSYNFVSEDGRFVLKLIKQHDCRSFWSHFLWLPMSARLRQKAAKAIEKVNVYRDAIFSSYFLAYTRLKEETGLIYLQINPQEIAEHPLILHDYLGVSHRVNPNQLVFAIQRRAELVGERIERLMKEGDVSGAKEAAMALLQLFYKRCEKGIKDLDHGKFCLNYGFTENTPLCIDIGQYIEEKTLAKDEARQHARSFKQWLEPNYPELASVVDQFTDENL